MPNLFGYQLHQRISSIRVYPQGSRAQNAPQARARTAKTKTTQLAQQTRNADSEDEDGDAGTNTALSWLIPTAHAKKDAPNTVHYEDQQYFYHTDHLGGTRYLTDKNGDVVESILTFPGGEPWVNQTIRRSADDYKTPYTFTGKEQDASGLYYYGARYYDPRAQIWASVDPILDKYLDGAVDGVYASSNLAMYTYARNNPVVLKDPDGNIVPLLVGIWAVAEVAMSAYDVYGAATALMDENASTTEKAVAVGGLVVGVFLPGAGYGTAGKKAAQQTAKYAEDVKTAANQASKQAKAKVDEAAETVASGAVKFKRWKNGDAIDKPMADGSAPSWDTVRSRYWKNRASSSNDEFSKENLARMKQGKAPLDFNPRTGKFESRELHHVVPQRAGGSNGPMNLRELTPDQHGAVDPFRHTVPTTKGIQ